MAKKSFRFPITLPLIATVVLVLGLLAGPFIKARATPEQLADNILLSAIPFVLVFVGILLYFITLIVIIARLLDNNISPRIHGIVLSILIAGIIIGILGMFQPWIFQAYKYGFLLLLFSTLGFIVWSHVTPRREQTQEEARPVSSGGLE
jgi:hypothetical protein